MKRKEFENLPVPTPKRNNSELIGKALEKRRMADTGSVQERKLLWPIHYKYRNWQAQFL